MLGDGRNTKEQQRNSQRLQPHSCEYRFGYSLPLGRLQQANYQALVTERERQKHTLTETNNMFQLQLQLQFHPVTHLLQNLPAPGPFLFSISHSSPSIRTP